MALKTWEFDFIRKLVYDTCAIVLERDREYAAEMKLQKLARKLDLSSVSEVVGALRADVGGHLREQLIGAMTNNETLFFRDPHVFESLKNDVIPHLLETRRERRRINIWCAASSTGQEPYSIAMTLRELSIHTSGWDIQFVASDIDTEALDRCRTGLYSGLEVGRGLPIDMRSRYFKPRSDQWEVAPELRRTITFQQINLAEPFPNLPKIDLLFLRNVLIYFDQDTKRRILAAAYRLMADDSFLVLGGGESTMMLNDDLDRQQMGKAMWYRRNPRKDLANTGS